MQSKRGDNSRTDEEDIGSISFGALAKAQETLGKRKRHDDLGPGTLSPHPEKRLRDHAGSEALERRAGKKDTRDFSRSSKHAPTELSSKKAVSRRREVVHVPKAEARDPRFEPLSGPINEFQTKKNYAFLETYRDSEISDLKAAIRKTEDADAKDKLKRALLSMESRKKTQLTKDKEQEVLSKHRKKEKELIQQGKKPFYLKKGEQKKMALVERFEGMKGKQADKVIERRRKKKAAKERKGMPEGRRGMEG